MRDGVRRMVVLLCFAWIAVAPQPGRAACAAPTVGAMPNARRAGQLVLLTGEDWSNGCDDTGGGDVGGCSRSRDAGDEDGPAIDTVVIDISRRGMSPIELATVDVRGSSSFAEEVRLPRDLEPGRYRIRAHGIPGGGRTWSPLVIFD